METARLMDEVMQQMSATEEKARDLMDRLEAVARSLEVSVARIAPDHPIRSPSSPDEFWLTELGAPR